MATFLRMGDKPRCERNLRRHLLSWLLPFTSTWALSWSQPVNLLSSPLDVAHDSYFDTLNVACTADAVLRAHVPGTLLPAASSSWTISAEVSGPATFGYILSVGDLSIRRSERHVILEDSEQTEQFSHDVGDWEAAPTRVSLSRSDTSGIILCIDDSLVPVPAALLSELSLAQGLTLGDRRSTDSLSGTYQALYLATQGAASCTAAAAITGDPPSGVATAVVDSVLSSKGVELFTNEVTDFSATASGPSGQRIKLQITAFGLTDPGCSTAECGDLTLVCWPRSRWGGCAWHARVLECSYEANTGQTDSV